jgi:hypothetical protein
MTSLMDMFENPEYLKTRDAFKADLDLIEQKHKEWFKNRTPVFDDEEHDRLHNHYNIIRDNRSITFVFDNNTPLPKEIIQECMEAYKTHFSQGQS